MASQCQRYRYRYFGTGRAPSRIDIGDVFTGRAGFVLRQPRHLLPWVLASGQASRQGRSMPIASAAIGNFTGVEDAGDVMSHFRIQERKPTKSRSSPGNH